MPKFKFIPKLKYRVVRKEKRIIEGKEVWVSIVPPGIADGVNTSRVNVKPKKYRYVVSEKIG